MGAQWYRIAGLCLMVLAVVSLVAMLGYEARQKPPQPLWYARLPIRGDWATARDAGFTRCVRITRTVRCRRENLSFAGIGPFNGALDLRHPDGGGGFHQLTLWHPGDQKMVGSVGRLLKAGGWSLCRTGPTEFRGDQEIYTRPGAPVRFSIDISYWGKRRLRILPEHGQPTGHCWST